MPFFLYPPEPPALIQPVAPTNKSDRPHPYLISQIAVDKPQSIEPTPPSEKSATDVTQTEDADGVIEVYYDDPKNLPPSPPPTSNDNSAASLGAPLSLESDPDPSSSNPVHTSQNATDTVSREVVFGLNQLSLSSKKTFAKVVIHQKSNGRTEEFQMSLTTPATPIAQTPDGQVPANPDPASEEIKTIELIADYQEYDEQQQVITARGNVTMRFANGLLTTDRLQISLPNRLAVAEGQVILTRGDQVLRGDRFEYYFVQDSGVVFNANGEIYQASTARDFSTGLPTDVSAGSASYQTLTDRLALNQPLQRVTTAEGVNFVFGAQSPDRRDGSNALRNQSGGTVNRLRFQAERLEFDAGVWKATNIRVTNDPFSPPELEVRAETATLRNIAPLVDELTLSNSRVVFDQRFAAPTFQDRLIFDKRDRQPNQFSFGYDGEERGGLYVQGTFPIVDNPYVRLVVTPQYLIQKALFPDAFQTSDRGRISPTDPDEEEGAFRPSVFGLVTDLDVNLGVRTDFQATASFSSLDFDEIEDEVRAKIRLQRRIGALANPYFLSFEYNYRERLFNGTLGYQTVDQSIGAIFVSPSIPLGNTGINLSYQFSIQNVNAPTDRIDLLPRNFTDNVINLTRFQGAVSISRAFLLWHGQPLAATPDAGLKYTPAPVLPYLILVLGLTGVESYYSSGDSQPSLTASVGLLGQLGHFSRPFFDYTGFNITLSQGLVGEQSPFFFDRYVDQKTLAFGITQQIYGPIRIGFQSSYNIDLNQEISTDYFIEFSRRTYSLLLRYNPVLELGSINIRISDFNWTGNPGTFEGTDVRPVIDGVAR